MYLILAVAVSYVVYWLAIWFVMENRFNEVNVVIVFDGDDLFDLIEVEPLEPYISCYVPLQHLLLVNHQQYRQN